MFEKILKAQISSKSLQLFRADGKAKSRAEEQTDVTKLMAAFRSLADAPKNIKFTYSFEVKITGPFDKISEHHARSLQC
jgi:hypothetical protein